MSSQKSQEKIEVGDVVVWDMDVSINQSLGRFRNQGPFVVTEANINSECLRVRRLNAETFNDEDGRQELPFWPSRFRRDESLTAVRRAKLNAKA